VTLLHSSRIVFLLLHWNKILLLFPHIEYVELLVSPNTIIFGGGISKYFDEFKDDLKSNCKIIPAENRNNSGIIGAAISAV